ncbi:MAG: TlpA family protein disulfide reductase [Pseudomonadota bacterium]
MRHSGLLRRSPKGLARLCAIVLGGLSLASGAGEGQLTPIPERPLAPSFELDDTDGVRHQLEQYRGEVVVVNFWATWCPPCREELPSLQRLWEDKRDQGLVVLGVNVGEDAERIFLFTADYPVDFPLLMDRDSTVIEAWPVRGIPTTFILDREGRMVYRAIGAREFDAPELRAHLRELLDD